MSSHERSSHHPYSSSDLSRWQDGPVVYQMYLRSWLDTTGSGEGDLDGAVQTLDMLGQLGVGAIWLNPIYPSGGKDGGYDIKDYTDIDAKYGGLEKFKVLLDEAHSRGMRIIMDFVPNHCSNQHPWFEASKDIDHPEHERYRDFFIWSDGKGNQPPNNMLSVFPERTYNPATEEWLPEKRSAWTWNMKRGKYYYHSFSPMQPDLNWEEPAVQNAMLKSVGFWMDIGVDALRVDAVNYLGKDPRLSTNPKILNEAVNPKYVHNPRRNPYDRLQRELSANGPRMFKHLGRIADVIATYDPPRFMFTEAYVDGDLSTIAGIYKRFHAIKPAVVAPFNFIPVDEGQKAASWQKFFDSYMGGLDGTAVLPLGNHDKPRLVTQFGRLRALGAAIMQFAMPNTMPVIYYGEELGLPNVPIPPEKVDDIFHLRDGARTPYPFNNTENAGMTTGTPWLPIHQNFQELSQATQSAQPDSVWNFYRTLIGSTKSMRRDGRYEMVYPDHPDVFAFKNVGNTASHYVLSNMSEREATARVHEKRHSSFLPSRALGQVLLNNYQDTDSYDARRLRSVTLRPNETVIIRQLSRWQLFKTWYQKQRTQPTPAV